MPQTSLLELFKPHGQLIQFSVYLILSLNTGTKPYAELATWHPTHREKDADFLQQGPGKLTVTPLPNGMQGQVQVS